MMYAKMITITSITHEQNVNRVAFMLASQNFPRADPPSWPLDTTSRYCKKFGYPIVPFCTGGQVAIVNSIYNSS